MMCVRMDTPIQGDPPLAWVARAMLAMQSLLPERENGAARTPPPVIKLIK